MCVYLNTHEELIRITLFAEYMNVMLKVMRVVKEARNFEKKRRLTSRKSDEMTVRKQKAKALFAGIRRGGISKEDIKRRLEEFFGKGSSKEIETATTADKCIE